ncbi:hypothetical protein GTW43_15350 [Streptomyces sp. SID5785]|nr:hypothetical protein [Streptomyces sp. SID5785]
MKDPGERATASEAETLLAQAHDNPSGTPRSATSACAVGQLPSIDEERRRRAVGALATVERAARACEGEEAAYLGQAARIWAELDATRALRLCDEAERLARDLVAVTLGHSFRLVDLVEAQAPTDPEAAEVMARAVHEPPWQRATAWLAVARGWLRPQEQPQEQPSS